MARCRPVAASQIRTVPSPAAGGQPAAIRRHRHRHHPARCGRSGWPAPARWPRPRSAPSASPPPEASQLPSGATATASTAPVWPVRAARSPPGGRVPDPHRPSIGAAGGQPAAIRRHRHRYHRAGVAGPGRPAPARWPHPRSAPSRPRRRRPASCHPAPPPPPLTRPVWPVRTARSRPVAASQIRTVPSSPPEASQLPSGATATAVTAPVWPVQDGPLLPGGRIPDPHRPVLAAGGQPAAIRRHRHRRHPAGVAGQGGPLPARWPHPRSAPSRPRRRRPASCHPAPPPPPSTAPVWPVRAARSRPVAASQIRTVPSRRRRPASCHPAPPPPPHPAGVAGQDGPLPPGGRIPDPHRPVLAAGGQPAAIRRHRHRRSPRRRGRSGRPAPARWPHPRSAPSRPRCRRPASCHPAPPPPRSPPGVAGQDGPLAARWPHPRSAPSRHRRRRPASCHPAPPPPPSPPPEWPASTRRSAGSARSGSGHRLTSRGRRQVSRKGSDLRPPVRVIGDPAVQDIHHGPGRLRGRQQVRRAREHTPQPGRPRCPGRG